MTTGIDESIRRLRTCFHVNLASRIGFKAEKEWVEALVSKFDDQEVLRQIKKRISMKTDKIDKEIIPKESIIRRLFRFLRITK